MKQAIFTTQERIGRAFCVWSARMMRGESSERRIDDEDSAAQNFPSAQNRSSPPRKSPFLLDACSKRFVFGAKRRRIKNKAGKKLSWSAEKQLFNLVPCRLKILVESSNTVFTLAFTQQVSETTTTTAEGGPAFSAAPVLYERERRANCQGEERGSWRRQERRLEGRGEREKMHRKEPRKSARKRRRGGGKGRFCFRQFFYNCASPCTTNCSRTHSTFQHAFFLINNVL